MTLNKLIKRLKQLRREVGPDAEVFFVVISKLNYEAGYDYLKLENIDPEPNVSAPTIEFQFVYDGG